MYQKITPLTEADHALENPELAALSRVWNERKDKLLESGEFK